jgi:quinol-cytochrome oxidoreductase complex cytochrome b subunit
MFQTLKYLPAEIMGIEGELLGILGFGVAGIGLLFIPFLDRGPRSSRAITVLAYGALFYILLLTWLGYTANPEL